MVPRLRYSLNWLARTLSVSLAKLQSVADDIPNHFRPGTVPKRRGGTRPIEKPSGELKHIQRQIIENILKTKNFEPYVHGSVRRRSALTNAAAHLNNQLVVTVDIRAFFPSVTHGTVYRIWCGTFECGPDVARLLTRLTTHKRQLPQGAPTSSYLANWALAPFDAVVEPAARGIGVSYTRYVDDICLSGHRATELIPIAIAQLARRGYAVGRDKVKIMGPHRSQAVTGYAVGRPSGPSVPRRVRDCLLTDIRSFLLGGGDVSMPTQKLASLKGRIAYVKRTNPGAAKRYARLLGVE